MSTTEPGSQSTLPTSVRPVTGPLTRHLVDDAAIFPPGNAPLPRAVAQHHRHRASWYAPAIGPLLVRLADASVLHGLLRDGGQLAVGLVCPPGATTDEIVGAVEQVQRDDRAVVTALEQPVGERAAIDALVAAARAVGAHAWAEVPADCTLDDTVHARLDDVAAAGACAKYRTGGVKPETFPSEQQLAAFLLACSRRQLPFKLTAGLHHAVRHTAHAAGENGQDLEQHGVLNVVAAAGAAQGGADLQHLVTVLGDRDATAVSRRVAALDDRFLHQVRRLFVSFGCCGVTDPLTDLVTLGLLDQRPIDQDGHHDDDHHGKETS